jgi:hypothetical protein
MFSRRISNPLKYKPFFCRFLNSTTKFEINPRLPVHNGFLLDTREKGERKVINSEWISKTGKNPIRIEMIDRKDFDLIGQFFTWHFAKHSNICRCLKMSYKDLEPFCLELLDSFIDKPLSFAAFDEEKLVAIKLNNTHTAEEFPEMYSEGLYHPNPKYEIKNDYSEIIKSSPYNLKCNHIYGIYMDVVKNTGKFLPNNCKKIGVLEATGIHEKYMGCGLIHYLYALSVKKFAEENCDNFASYCVAAATYESGKKIGMKHFIGLPYDAVKVDGKFPLFDMYDGATTFRAMLGNVKDSLKIVSPLL